MREMWVIDHELVVARKEKKNGNVRFYTIGKV